MTYHVATQNNFFSLEANPFLLQILKQIFFYGNIILYLNQNENEVSELLKHFTYSLEKTIK